MLKGLLRLLVVLVALSPAVVMAAPPEWCVRIFVNEKGDYVPECIGSGSLIAPDMVVTNYHVVKDRKDDKALQVMFSDWMVSAEAEVVAESKQWDLALIRIRRTTKTPIELGNDPTYMSIVTMHGYGYGVYAVGPGRVENYAVIDNLGSTEGDEKDDLQVAVGVGARSGDSGGPVTINGKLVGVVTMTDGRRTVFIVQSQVRKLLKTLE